MPGLGRPVETDENSTCENTTSPEFEETSHFHKLKENRLADFGIPPFEILRITTDLGESYLRLENDASALVLPEQPIQ